MSSIAAPRVRDLQGLWRRSLLIRPDGLRDSATEVRWLQGIAAYIDLRQPASLPKFTGKRGLEDISMDECAVLALQEGFAGHLSFDGSHFEWARDIDFQPKGLHSDVGSLGWEGDILIERGRDVEYIEHWHRDEPGTAPPAAAGAAVSLRDVESGTRGSLLRVGRVFMFARARLGILAAHKTLAECLAEAPSLKAAQSLIDCEISFGVVTAERFLITASSLPHRMGDSLDPRYSGRRLETMDRAPAGNIVARHWEITELEGALHTVAGKSAALDFL